MKGSRSRSLIFSVCLLFAWLLLDIISADDTKSNAGIDRRKADRYNDYE